MAFPPAIIHLMFPALLVLPSLFYGCWAEEKVPRDAGAGQDAAADAGAYQDSGTAPDAGCTGDCTGKYCGDGDGCGGRCTGCVVDGETCDIDAWKCAGSGVCKLKVGQLLVDFGSVGGGKVASQIVMISNHGDAACAVFQVQGPGDPAFAVKEVSDDHGGPVDWAAPFQIDAGSFAEMKLSFTAPMQGDPKCTRTGKVSLFSNSAIGSPVDIGLKGTGCLP